MTRKKRGSEVALLGKQTTVVRLTESAAPLPPHAGSSERERSFVRLTAKWEEETTVGQADNSDHRILKHFVRLTTNKHKATTLCLLSG